MSTSISATPYELMGGEDRVRALVSRFYTRMAMEEQPLARLHEVDDEGFVSARTQERFALFLIEWLGGPRRFSELYGHPRLRMRHAHVPIGVDMRDAWLRSMSGALDDLALFGDLRVFLDERLAHVADFLRNIPESNE